MFQFRTIIPLTPASWKIGYPISIFLIGSCFTQSIGTRLREKKIEVAMNPFGVVFNPISLAQQIEHLLEKESYVAEELDSYEQRWFSYFHHSSFASRNATESLDRLNHALNLGKQKLKKSSYLVITWGSAWVYHLKGSGALVANCHKVPARYFERRLLSVEMIVSYYLKWIQKLERFNPELKLIFTVSPVRHTRDGFIENQWSKSTLLLALHQLQTQHPSISYFPSYEIMMDDLRDYRFYEPDLIHPNTQAIDYIWEHFQKTYFSEASIHFMQQIESLQKASQHQPFDWESEAHQQFIAIQLTKIEKLKAEYPFLDFTSEQRQLLQKPTSISDREE